MLLGLFILLALQVISELLVNWLHLPIPSTVIGMLILWIGLNLRKEKNVPTPIDAAVSPLIKHLALFFVPLNVGIIGYWDILKQEGWIIGCAMAAGLVIPLLLVAGGLELWFNKQSKS